MLSALAGGWLILKVCARSLSVGSSSARRMRCSSSTSPLLRNYVVAGRTWNTISSYILQQDNSTAQTSSSHARNVTQKRKPKRYCIRNAWTQVTGTCNNRSPHRMCKSKCLEKNWIRSFPTPELRAWELHKLRYLVQPHSLRQIECVRPIWHHARSYRHHRSRSADCPRYSIKTVAILDVAAFHHTPENGSNEGAREELWN